MNVFKDLQEVDDAQIRLKNMTDDILDSYKKNPKECEKLLIELNNINNELKELEIEFSKFI